MFGVRVLIPEIGLVAEGEQGGGQACSHGAIKATMAADQRKPQTAAGWQKETRTPFPVFSWIAPSRVLRCRVGGTAYADLLPPGALGHGPWPIGISLGLCHLSVLCSSSSCFTTPPSAFLFFWAAAATAGDLPQSQTIPPGTPCSAPSPAFFSLLSSASFHLSSFVAYFPEETRQFGLPASRLLSRFTPPRSRSPAGPPLAAVIDFQPRHNRPPAGFALPVHKVVDNAHGHGHWR